MTEAHNPGERGISVAARPCRDPNQIRSSSTRDTRVTGTSNSWPPERSRGRRVRQVACPGSLAAQRRLGSVSHRIEGSVIGDSDRFSRDEGKALGVLFKYTLIGQWPQVVIIADANVAELADAQDLGSCPARGPGSTPGVRIQPANRRPSSRWGPGRDSSIAGLRPRPYGIAGGRTWTGASLDLESASRVLPSEAKEPKRGYVSFAPLRMTHDVAPPAPLHLSPRQRPARFPRK